MTVWPYKGYCSLWASVSLSVIKTGWADGNLVNLWVHMFLPILTLRYTDYVLMPMSEGAWRNWRSGDLIHSEKFTAASLIYKVFPFKLYAYCWSWSLCPQSATQGLPVAWRHQFLLLQCHKVQVGSGLRWSWGCWDRASPWASSLDKVNLHILTCGILPPTPRLSSNHSRWPSEVGLGTVPSSCPQTLACSLGTQGWSHQIATCKMILTTFTRTLSSPCHDRPHLHPVPDPAAGLHSWGVSRLLLFLAVLLE